MKKTNKVNVKKNKLDDSQGQVVEDNSFNQNTTLQIGTFEEISTKMHADGMYSPIEILRGRFDAFDSVSISEAGSDNFSKRVNKNA